MPKIKFCGLTTSNDITAANLVQPDYIGFVFYHKSRRYLTQHQAAILAKELAPRIAKVGVFVNATISEILAYGDIIDLIQLHGEEDATFIADLRQHTSKKIIQAYKITDSTDIARARLTTADYPLLDAGMGDGRAFDWQLINNLGQDYFLAGGLNAANLNEALKFKPYALDVSSGVEKDGRKDEGLMREFIAKVRDEKYSS